MDQDLRSIQQARTLLQKAADAQKEYREFSQETVDQIVREMATAGEKAAERLARLAVEETGFGRVESKVQKNLFATRMLADRMADMRTCGVVRTLEDGSIWEIATPMGVVAALVPSTNPTSTAMYKAIIAAKARCGIVLSPHPRATNCTCEALTLVAEAAYAAGAPDGLFGCLTEVSLDGTNALLEDERTDLILATGGSAMVRAAYSKGKPAYGVGSGNVPAYVDRSADLEKAAKDLVYGAYFDHGTLCSTERSIVADVPIRGKLLEQLRRAGAFVLNDAEKEQLRAYVVKNGRLNVEQVGQSPSKIAAAAGFSVPSKTRALVAEVESVGTIEPLSLETLSPILSFYKADGWEAGCQRCKEILAYGGIGHTLGLHCGNERIIEAFALEKPAMRIVVNSVCALGAVGYTNRLFPAMTLGPGTLGGSITSDNISPLHLINVKRLAFETDPVHPARKRGRPTPEHAVRGPASAGKSKTASPWMEEIDARLRARAGNPASLGRAGGDGASGPTLRKPHAPKRAAEGPSDDSNAKPEKTPSQAGAESSPNTPSAATTLSENEIEALIRKFRK